MHTPKYNDLPCLPMIIHSQHLPYMGKHGHLYQRERGALYSLGIADNGQPTWHAYTLPGSPIDYCVLRYSTSG